MFKQNDDNTQKNLQFQMDIENELACVVMDENKANRSGMAAASAGWRSPRICGGCLQPRLLPRSAARSGAWSFPGCAGYAVHRVVGLRGRYAVPRRAGGPGGVRAVLPVEVRDVFTPLLLKK